MPDQCWFLKCRLRDDQCRVLGDKTPGLGTRCPAAWWLDYLRHSMSPSSLSMSWGPPESVLPEPRISGDMLAKCQKWVITRGLWVGNQIIQLGWARIQLARGPRSGGIRNSEIPALTRSMIDVICSNVMCRIISMQWYRERSNWNSISPSKNHSWMTEGSKMKAASN